MCKMVDEKNYDMFVLLVGGCANSWIPLRTDHLEVASFARCDHKEDKDKRAEESFAMRAAPVVLPPLSEAIVSVYVVACTVQLKPSWRVCQWLHVPVFLTACEVFLLGVAWSARQIQCTSILEQLPLFGLLIASCGIIYDSTPIEFVNIYEFT